MRGGVARHDEPRPVALLVEPELAVQAGRVHRVDAATWMEFSGAGSAHRVLDDVERYLLEGE